MTVPGTVAAGVRRRLPSAIALAALALTACSSAGPADVDSGQYRLLGTSSPGQSVPTDVSLVVDGSVLRLMSGARSSQYTLGEAGAEYTVCPPSGRGAPRTLDAPMSLGDLDVAQPAVFGDCGAARPQRITVVDLASVDEADRFPFTRWAEFCNVADPDCA